MIITKEILKETGYSTWYDFNANIFSNQAKSFTKHHYVYHNPDNVEKEIELDVSQNMILALAQEEILIMLKEFGFNDYKELLHLMRKHNRINSNRFTLEKTEVSKDKEVILKRYVLTPSAVDRAFSIEIENTLYY